MRSHRMVGLLAVGMIGLLVATATVSKSPNARHHFVVKTSQADAQFVAASVPLDVDVAEVMGYFDWLGFVARLAEEQRAVDAYLSDLWQASQRVVAPRPALVTGSCCGPHSDLWWQGVARCEQGGINHPFFGFFSIMDGSAGGLPWGTQVAMANAILARAGREVPTWAQSCVTMGYQYSPGG